MHLKENIEEKLKKEISNISDKKIIISLPFDIKQIGIDEKGSYSTGYIVVTERHFCLIKQSIDSSYQIDREYNLANISEFKVQTQIASAHLEVKVEDQLVILCRFSMSLLEDYQAAIQYLNKFLQGEKRAVIPPREKKRCSDCGRVYPDKTGICPSCIKKWKILNRLWKVMKPHISLIIFSMVLLWLTTAASLIQPQLQRIMVDDVLRSGEGTLRMLITILAAMFSLAILAMGLRVLRSRIMTKLGSSLGKELRQEVYSKIQELSLKYLSENKVGQLMNRVTGDTATINGFIREHSGNLLNQIFIFLGILLILLRQNWQLAVIVLIPIPIVLYINSLTIDKIRKMFKRERQAWDKVNSLLQDILNGIRVVKAAIAHHLATLRNASRLMVIDQGRKAEIGTHKELMEQKGIYYDLVMAQKEMNRTKAVGG